ncbi:MAG: thiamine-binding protein [Ilumatobacter sp.]|nr:thiamine-binding protein [bacterium]MCP4836425.1 hypothetical protein [Phycisphaera sp.]MDG1267113.1 thiamine-binding protein [Ilumatobacter sp.]NKB40342.1 hypothetical protein [Ilumatobacter sp.]
MTASDQPIRARLEVLVEPFRENDPGPHVNAAIDAIGEAGMQPDMGPFATTAEGDLDQAVAAITALVRAGFDHGADAIQIRVERTD